MASHDTNPTQGFHATRDQLDWGSEAEYWREHWHTRPYVTADQGYSYYEPAFRYGTESAIQHRGKFWDDVEPDLRAGWDRYEHHGSSTWENMKDAVRDAWNRVTNR